MPRRGRRQRGAAAVEPTDLLAALVDEAESRAAELLAEFGLDPARVWAALGTEAQVGAGSRSRGPTRTAAAVARAPRGAGRRGDPGARDSTGPGRSAPSTCWRASCPRPGRSPTCSPPRGSSSRRCGERLTEAVAVETAPIPLPRDIPPLELGEPAQAVDLGRILDASANRAREGLRVVEDYARFALDDPGLTRRLKEVRHRLAEALAGLDPDLLIGSRDTRGDVGTHIMTASERSRENPRAVLAANFKRTAEALRSLEEYGKLVDVWLAGRFEVLRYDVYTLEKLTLTAAASARALGDARLMVLVGGLPTLGDLTWVVGEALAGGADVIQLREKGLPDREWLAPRPRGPDPDGAGPGPVRRQRPPRPRPARRRRRASTSARTTSPSATPAGSSARRR